MFIADGHQSVSRSSPCRPARRRGAQFAPSFALRGAGDAGTILTVTGSRCTVGGEVGQTRGVNRERQHQGRTWSIAESFSSAPALGVAVAGAVAAFPQGVWAGITKTSARKPLRVGNLLTLSGPSSAPSVDIKRGFGPM